MVVLTGVIVPSILEAALPQVNIDVGSRSETIEVILTLGPCIHCILMPFLWTHKHRTVKKWIENRSSTDDIVKASALDPEVKTVIFARKLACAKSLTVLLASLTIGLVDLVLWTVKTFSLGTINLKAFWFPSPFYNFWRAKMQIDLIQINGVKICTTANQSDAYMKFCTDAMINFWTLGIYGLCCSNRTSYGRWLDRHVLWQGMPPKGYNNQFRIFDDKLSCGQKIKCNLVVLIGFLLGGFLSMIPIVGGLWPLGLMLPWYLCTIKLGDMKLGGSDPTFAKKFPCCNYIIKYYTIGICGLSGMPVKRWVDKCVVMGKPSFDEDMANQNSQADTTNPDDLNQHYANQSADGPPELLDPNRAVSFVKRNAIEMQSGKLPSAASKIDAVKRVVSKATSKVDEPKRLSRLALMAVWVRQPPRPRPKSTQTQVEPICANGHLPD